MYILSHYVYENICNVNSIEINVLFKSENYDYPWCLALKTQKPVGS